MRRTDDTQHPWSLDSLSRDGAITAWDVVVKDTEQGPRQMSAKYVTEIYTNSKSKAERVMKT